MEKEKSKYELSLCLPIYNRLECFKYTFDRLIEQLKRLNVEEKRIVEVVVSVNPSEDTIEDTKNYLHSKQGEFYFHINVNENNIGISGNLDKVVHLAQGRMIWIIGDDDQILDGCVSRVIKILKKYQDVNWIYLSSARLSGFPNDRNAFVTAVNNYRLPYGYHRDGKKTAINVHNRIGGGMLFSSSNIYLRDKYLEIAEESKGEGYQLGPTFSSAAQGAVFLDNQIGVLAGGYVSWSGIADYSIAVRYYLDICSATGHGYSQGEIKKIISYNMWHEALSTWFLIYKMCFKGSENGKKAFGFFYRLLPVQTLLTIFLVPVIALYLWLRHFLRNIRRKKSCIDYVKSESPEAIVVSRIRI